MSSIGSYNVSQKIFAVNIAASETLTVPRTEDIAIKQTIGDIAFRPGTAAGQNVFQGFVADTAGAAGVGKWVTFADTGHGPDTFPAITSSAADSLAFYGHTPEAIGPGAFVQPTTVSGPGTVAPIASGALTTITDTATDQSAPINNNFATLRQEVADMRTFLVAVGLMEHS